MRVAIAATTIIRIPAEDLDTALRTFEKDVGLELIFVAEDVRGVRTNGASGNLTVEETLNELLAGTGLTYHYVDRTTITILPGDRVPRAVHHEAKPTQPSALEQVVVTAQKRSEYVQSVPVSMSVIAGPTLEEWGGTQLTDFSDYISGLTVVQGAAPGEDMLILRGLGMPSESALVGTYIDDTPVGASSAQQPTTRRALDLLPYDFERVEVLEGPQGTLYGANAMGGLVKYVTRQPDLENTSARIGVDFKENDTASEAGWNARGSLNSPIVPGRAGIRVSVSQDFTPGFVNEPNQGRTDSNQVREQAGHFALRVEPSQRWSVDLAALIQHLDSPDPAVVTLSSAGAAAGGRLVNFDQVPQTFDSKLQFYSLRANGDWHWASFTSATGYSVMQSSAWGQAGYALDQLTGRAAQSLQVTTDKLTQELRLTSPGQGRLEWLIGAFYTRENGNQLQSGYALNAANSIVPELHLFVPFQYREYALFGHSTWKLTNALAMTVGLRESRNEQTYAGIPACSAAYVSAIAPCPPVGSGTSHQDVFNFTAGPSYHFSPDVMAYFSASSGYRPGGPNVPAPGIASTVAADTLMSLELGIKSTWWDRKLRFNAAVYQIKWDRIQIIATAPPPLNVSYGANGNSALVRGFEAATTFAPVANLRLGANLVLTHAALSAPMPSASTLVGASGDRLPYVPLWSGSLTADYTHALWQDWTGALGVGWRYTGQRYTTIDNSGNCPNSCAGAQGVPSLRSYSVMDLHASVSDDSWSVRLAVRNLTNTHALVDIYGGGGQTFDREPVEATVLSARLLTLGVERRF